MMYTNEKLKTISLLGNLLSKKAIELDESLILEVGMYLTGEMEENGLDVEETIQDLLELPGK